MDKKYFRVGDLVYLNLHNGKIFYGKITKFLNNLDHLPYRANTKVKWFDDHDSTNGECEKLTLLNLSNIWKR